MVKTKAAFKALREECGMSQSDIASEFDVSVESVKRWENPSYERVAPDEIWQWLLSCRGSVHEDAREIAEQIIESVKDVPGAHDLALDYFRTQDDLDAVQLPGADEPVGYVNARMRLVGRLLDKEEIPYTYRYAGRVDDAQAIRYNR